MAATAKNMPPWGRTSPTQLWSMTWEYGRVVGLISSGEKCLVMALQLTANH